MRKDGSQKDVYTTRELAEILGVDIETVRRRLRKGELPEAEKFGGQWVVWKDKFNAKRGLNGASNKRNLREVVEAELDQLLTLADDGTIDWRKVERLQRILGEFDEGRAA